MISNKKKPENFAVFKDRDSTDKGGFFRDGKRRIDFVLAYEIPTEWDADSRQDERQRVAFYDSLIQKKMHLEIEIGPDSSGNDARQAFVKVHATWEALSRYAEILHTWMPIEYLGETPQSAALAKTFDERNSCSGRAFSCFDYDHNAIPDDIDYFSAPFSSERASLFRIDGGANFFSDPQRSRIVWRILSDASYGPSHLEFGIQRLLSMSVFTAAFPLHDCDMPDGKGAKSSSSSSGVNKVEKQQQQVMQTNKRAMLYQNWTSVRHMFKYQPVDAIRDYFGEQIGMYFAWLGDYTTFLLFLAGVSCITGIYGIATFNNEPTVANVCSIEKLGCVVMCPLCSEGCDFWALQNSCFSIVLAYLCDNASTIFYAVTTTLWATVFLEYWNRHEMQLKYDWDVHSYTNREPVRPEYEATASSTRIDPVTLHEEPHEPLLMRILRGLASWTVIAVLIIVVFGAMLSIILYRQTLSFALYLASVTETKHSEFLDSYGRFLVTLSAAVVNLIVILILTFVYDWLAYRLTELERPRTQSQFDNSLAIKQFIFQFVNCYGTIFYTAFFRGRFQTIHEADPYQESMAQKSVEYFSEECDPAGCMTDLAIQLATVMIGRQFVLTLMEIAVPYLSGRRQWLRSKCCPKKYHASRSSSVSPLTQKGSMTRWEADFQLADFSRPGICNEYLEMVIQFGFVTLFGVCFPLSSLFALVNNIFEIRLDSFKLISVYRRPVATMADGIGIWGSILRALLSMSIVSNALIIAFTSDSVQRFAFDWQIVSPRSLEINSPPSLTNSSEFHQTYFSFSTSVLKKNNTVSTHIKLDNQQCVNKAYNDPASLGGFELQPSSQLENGSISYCYFRGLHEPPWSPNAYDFKSAHWELRVFRLEFALAFIVVVWMLSWFISKIIPRRTEKVKQFQRYEDYLREKALLAHTADVPGGQRNNQNGTQTASRRTIHVH